MDEVVPMTVRDLIKFLKTQPKDLPVAFKKYSEYCLLRTEQVKTLDLCHPRGDDWVHDQRPDKPSTAYLVFPGN